MASICDDSTSDSLGVPCTGFISTGESHGFDWVTVCTFGTEEADIGGAVKSEMKNKRSDIATIVIKPAIHARTKGFLVDRCI